MGTFGLIGLMVAVLALGVIVRAFVLTVLWSWFVVPTFDLRPLAIPAAMGLSLIVGMLSYQETKTYPPDKPTSEVFGEMIGMMFAPLAALAFGAFVHLWMP